MNFTLGTTFSAFKKDFYGKTKDLSLYNCGDINILKVVLDGLKVNYISRGRIRLPFFLPDVLWNLTQAIKRKKNTGITALKENKDTRILVADLSGRSETDKEGKPQSYYFDTLLSEFQPGEYLHVAEYFKKKGYPHDLDFRELSYLQYIPADDHERKLRKDLLHTFSNIKNSKAFSKAELTNIQIAIQSFYCQYKIWNEILRKLPAIKYCLLEQHYHHEGLLLALKKNKIRSYEIQHGLISENDIFYVFPKEVSAIRDKALFPDKILVYGEYWKNTLLKGSEFAEENIALVGDFRKKSESFASQEETKTINDFSAKHKVILVSSQTFMHDFYANYTLGLADLLRSKHTDWKIILKLHPNEKEENYSSLKNIPNVLISKSNILGLFKLASIHISVYSTTLYDALEYELVNFSLMNEGFKDYSSNIVKDKIAHPLEQQEDPVERSKEFLHTTSPTTSTLVYAPVMPANFKNLFLN